MRKIGLLPSEPEDGGKQLRTRRNKSKNFHEDYVYDEKTLKDTISQKNTLNGGSATAEQKAAAAK